jgi:hypothetical protein
MAKELGDVVADRLAVYGTKILRVCDTSVFLVISWGNILSSVSELYPSNTLSFQRPCLPLRAVT